MKVEVDIEVGDIIKFNDEVWEVVNSPYGSGSLDMQSVNGRLENFTRKEMKEQIPMAGKFSRVKKDYVGISSSEVF